MIVKFSSGLNTKLLDTGSLKSIFETGNGGHIRIFSGTPPATADAAETGTLLCKITVSSIATGASGSTLTFDVNAALGVLTKNTDAWSGLNLASGVATHYRHVATGDTGAASTTEPRMQGAVAVVGAELNLSSTTLVGGATQTINYCSITLPA